MRPPADFAGMLAAGQMIEAPAVLVAAHPDDEILGLGSRLRCFRRLRLIHLTDGAPGDMADARQSGCAERHAYAALREAELDAALAAAGAHGAARTNYGWPDQEAILRIADIVDRLAGDLAGASAVVTHPYEHGHPDHDTAALAVWLACRRMARRGRVPPARYEFASYHLRDGAGVYGAFWPDGRAPATEIALGAAAAASKISALACFASQRAVIARFPVDREYIRPAPSYDFTRPAPPGVSLYDHHCAITAADWRRHAAGVPPVAPNCVPCP